MSRLVAKMTKALHQRTIEDGPFVTQPCAVLSIRYSPSNDTLTVLIGTLEEPEPQLGPKGLTGNTSSETAGTQDRKWDPSQNCYCGGPEEIFPHEHGTGAHCRKHKKEVIEP